jgi:hypothetical protein
VEADPEAYYLPDGPERWVPTVATERDPDAQHGGPPAALAVHAMETAVAADPTPMRTALSRWSSSATSPVTRSPSRRRSPGPGGGSACWRRG